MPLRLDPGTLRTRAETFSRRRFQERMTPLLAAGPAGGPDG